MKMQDKDLDNLFRQKLDDFETEPSAMVWQNIDAELRTKQRKKAILLPLLSAAASIIVMVTAGVWFLSHKTAVTENKPAKQFTSAAHNAVKQQPVTHIATLPVVPKVKPGFVVTSQPVKAQFAKASKPVVIQKDSTVKKEHVLPQQSINALVAEGPEEQNASVAATIDTVATPATVATLTNNQRAINPVAIVANSKPVAKPASTLPKKHGIRSLGDILNVVIAKVDKRKDKILEFTDTDDDESTITGVNLGIIAVKKQN